METDVLTSSDEYRRRHGRAPTALLLGVAGVAGCLLLAGLLWQHGRQDAEREFVSRHQPAFEAIIDALDDSALLTSQIGRAMAVTVSTERDPLLKALAATHQRAFDHHLELAAWIEPRTEQDGAPYQLAAVHAADETLDSTAAEALLLSDRLASLNRAADRGELTVAQEPVLINSAGGGVRPGRMLIQPVQGGDGSLAGLVATVIRFDKLLERHASDAAVNLHLFESSGLNGRTLPLYTNQDGNAGRTVLSLEAMPHLQRDLRVGDRVWSTWLVPAQPLPTSLPATHWMTLAAILTLLLALTAIAHLREREWWALAQRSQDRERLLGELRRSNDDLRQENRQLDERLSRERSRLRARGLRLRDAVECNDTLAAESWMFQRTFDDAAAPLALFDPNTGICIRANLAFSELLGYSGSELTGLDFRALTHPADIERTPRLVRAAMRGGQDRFRAEKRYLHRSGQVIWCEVAVALLRDRDGRPRYAAVQAHDISTHRSGQDAPAPEQGVTVPH